MRVLVLAGVLGLAAALPAAAGDHARGGHDSVWSQRDVPGDYRCDAYWDRGRDDCDARWRDQRREPARRRHHSRHDHGYASYGYGYGYGHGGAEAYHGAWGRPDLVYGGSGHAAGGRDPARMAWCRATYRSWNPVTGDYIAYSGRRVFCG